MSRILACLLLVLVTCLPRAFAQAEDPGRLVEVVLQNGTRVQGLLLDFGDRTYRLRVGDRTLEFRESEIAAVNFNRAGLNPAPAGGTKGLGAGSPAANLDAALDAFEDALRVEPGSPKALANYARALEASRRTDEARVHFERALQAYQDLEQVGASGPRDYHDRASILAALGRLDEAIEFLKKAIAFHTSSRDQGLASAEVETLVAGLLRRQDELQAMLQAQRAAQAAGTTDAATPAPALRPVALEVWMDAPEILVSAPADRQGRVRLPWVGELDASGPADPTRAGEVASRFRHASPAIEPRGTRTFARNSFEESSPLGATPLPPEETVRLEVLGHPEWRADLRVRPGETVTKSIEGLGKLATAVANPSWQDLLETARTLVDRRDPSATVWLRRLPNPAVPPISMVAALDETLAALGGDPAVAASLQRLWLQEQGGSLEGIIDDADRLARVGELFRTRARLSLQVSEARPTVGFKEEATRLHYSATLGFAPQALRTWIAEEGQARVAAPAAALETADFIARLAAIAKAQGVTLGRVQGNERGVGMQFMADLTGSEPAALLRALRELEKGAPSLLAEKLELRQAALNPTNPASWHLSAYFLSGYPADPLDAADPLPTHGDAGARQAPQPSRDEPRVTLSLTDYPIDRVVEAVAKLANRSIIVQPEAQDLARQTRVSVHVQDVAWRAVLESVIGQSPDLELVDGPGGMLEVRRRAGIKPR